MANTWFRFKKFTVYQDKTAMKVGTDGVLLGAWADLNSCKNILDVGTGTGLIALMAAQRNHDANICAIDIDEDATQQAYENFQLSDWKDRLSVVHSSFQDFTVNNDPLFDIVISNPPFFINAYKSNDVKRNTARHNDSLPYETLVDSAYSITGSEGRLAVVIPFEAEEAFLRISLDYNFHLRRLLHIRPTPHKLFVRSLIEVSKEKVSKPDANSLVVEDKGRHNYSDDYINLTKEFYLAF